MSMYFLNHCINVFFLQILFDMYRSEYLLNSVPLGPDFLDVITDYFTYLFYCVELFCFLESE